MKKLLPVATGAFALLTLSGFAQAADNDYGLYVGGNYGYVKVDGQDDFDDDNDVYQGLLGFRFNKYLALEGSYIDFGDYGKSGASASTDGYTAALKVIAPIGERVELYGKGGQLWYNTDYSVLGVNGSRDDEGVFAGAGVGFKVTDNFLVNVEYTWYDADIDADAVSNGADTETDFKQASVGVEYRF
ncbi:porin family protein [Vibrio viridaestus]|uniref:Porin family protein n=1 Tax=Vibrio viridaestus TaxID=2487322 RepID=A0A3N9THW9_9VIBR|nr:porin family protein [Vibrio viridaestus]RQW63494.1 porin family protein [Vibrio viridaestus]